MRIVVIQMFQITVGVLLMGLIISILLLSNFFTSNVHTELQKELADGNQHSVELGGIFSNKITDIQKTLADIYQDTVTLFSKNIDIEFQNELADRSHKNFELQYNIKLLSTLIDQMSELHNENIELALENERKLIRQLQDQVITKAKELASCQKLLDESIFYYHIPELSIHLHPIVLYRISIVIVIGAVIVGAVIVGGLTYWYSTNEEEITEFSFNPKRVFSRPIFR